jgi:hypothetical protein
MAHKNALRVGIARDKVCYLVYREKYTPRGVQCNWLSRESHDACVLLDLDVSTRCVFFRMASC